MSASPCITEALAGVVDMPVHFMTLVETAGRPQFLCLSDSHFFLIYKDLTVISQKTPYSLIEKCAADLTMLELALSTSPPCTLLLKTEIPRQVVENLACYWQINHMFKTGKYADFPLFAEGAQIRAQNFTLQGQVNEVSTQLAQHFYMRPGLTPYSRRGYVFYLPSEFAEDSDLQSGGVFVKPALTRELEPTITVVQLSQQLPLEQLDVKSEVRTDLCTMAESYVHGWLRSVNHDGPFWLMSSQNYIKRQNLSSDQSVWEGWSVHMRTGAQDIYSVTIRRKFIPPTMDRFRDIVFILLTSFDPQTFLEQMLHIVEGGVQATLQPQDSFMGGDELLDARSSRRGSRVSRLSTPAGAHATAAAPSTTPGQFYADSVLEQEKQIFVADTSREAWKQLTEAVDSLHPGESGGEIMHEVVHERCTALLFTDDMVQFYKNELDIVPEQSEIQAVYLLRRVLYLLKRNNPASKLLKEMLHEVTSKLQGRVNYREQQRMNLQKTSAYELWEMFGGTGKTAGDVAWRSKLSKYFAFCFDGGLLYEGFNLTIMLDHMKSLDTNDNDELRFVLSQLLHFHRVGKDTIAGDSVGASIILLVESTSMLDHAQETISVNADDISRLQNFEFNHRVMEQLVLHDWLLHHLSNPYAYTKFFVDALHPQTFWTSQRLRLAVLTRIRDIFRNTQVEGGAAMGRTDVFQLKIVPPIIRAFAEGDKALAVLAAEALIHIAQLDTFRMFMMREGTSKALRERLEAPQDPVVLEITVDLLEHATRAKDASMLLLIEIPVQRLLDLMLEIVRGNVRNIPGAFYTAQTANSALQAIMNILKWQNKKILVGREDSEDALGILVSRINSTPYQFKSTKETALECERTIYQIMEVLVTGSSQSFKARLASLVIPRIVERVFDGLEREEDLKKQKSTPVMVSYLVAHSTDCTEAIGLMAELEEFFDRLRTAQYKKEETEFKQVNKHATVLLQRLTSVY